MNSLSELNGVASATFEYVDTRPSGVVYDIAKPIPSLDKVIVISSTSIAYTPNINIVEVVNYQTANVRYQVTIHTGGEGQALLTDSAIQWASIPSGLTKTVAGDVYTISGINAPSQWNSIRSFTWVLPSNYIAYPHWYLEVAIIYYDSSAAKDIKLSWYVYDDRFYYVSQMLNETSLSINVLRYAGITKRLTCTAKLECVEGPVKLFAADFNAAFTFDLHQLDRYLASAELISRATVYCKPDIIQVTHSGIPRTYLTNQGNFIFASSTPQIDDVNPTQSFTVTFTSPNGQFGNTDNSYATYSITGSLTEVNDRIALTVFYPTKDYASNTTFTIKKYANGVQTFSKTQSLNYGGAAPAYQNFYVFSDAGSNTWTPTIEEKKYCFASIVVVGGGGGGTPAYNNTNYNARGCGGGGGGVLHNTYLSITDTSYPITVGAGGAAWQMISGSTSLSGGGLPGGSSSAFGYTATGGTGAGFTTSPSTQSSGSSGYPSYLGATTRVAGLSGAGIYGAGGSGAGGAGANGSTVSGSSGSYFVGGDGGNDYEVTLFDTFKLKFGGGGGGMLGGKGGGYNTGNGSTFTDPTKGSISGVPNLTTVATGAQNGGLDNTIGWVWTDANDVVHTITIPNPGLGGGGGGGQADTINTVISNRTAGNGGSGLVIIRTHNT